MLYYNTRRGLGNETTIPAAEQHMNTCGNHERCIGKALRQADKICRANGLRLTELRRRVLELVWEDHAPTKAYGILDRLRAGGIPAKPPTVYRALDFLLDQGLIHRLNSHSAYIGCLHPLRHSECYFLICSRCSEVKECCNPQLASAVTRTVGRNRFRPRRTTLEIEGECRKCKKH